MTKVRSKNEAKRQQILIAATELFTEQGYASTSMSIIAKRASVSKQTVYSHFGSKEELFSASISQKCDSMIILDISKLDVTDPKAMLVEFGRRFLSVITSKEALAVHKICAFESKAYPQLSELFYDAGPERITVQVAKMMARLNDEGILKIPNPRYAALHYLHLVKGEAWMRVEFNTKKQLTTREVEDYLDATVEFFMKGYTK